MAQAQAAPGPVDAATAMANTRKLIDQPDIPYESFTLPNGLRVLVVTDRSTPIVGVSVWYDVGSKHEPAGRSGFAHLFEHLMFNGWENVPGEYFKPLAEIGARFNGETSEYVTTYFETIPTGALDLAFFMESDRMGHLAGAINHATLEPRWRSTSVQRALAAVVIALQKLQLAVA